MITRIEDFFAKGCGRCARFDTPDCSVRLWQDGVLALRALMLDCGLAEVVKWGHPCYRLGDRNIALIGAFRGDFRLSFMNAALLTDPEGLLRPSGPNTQTADVISFPDAQSVAVQAGAIRALIEQAKGFARAGIKAPRRTELPELPDDLVEALDADPELAEAFHRLTPGRQRSYVIALSSVKAQATRLRRIDGFRPRVLAGKGANEL